MPGLGAAALALPGARRLHPAQLISFCLPVSANEGDAYPLGALPVGTLICNLESHPGKGAQYIRAAGASLGRVPPSVAGFGLVQRERRAGGHCSEWPVIGSFCPLFSLC